jgi:esterase/lipase
MDKILKLKTELATAKESTNAYKGLLNTLMNEIEALRQTNDEIQIQQTEKQYGEGLQNYLKFKELIKGVDRKINKIEMKIISRQQEQDNESDSEESIEGELTI